MALGDHPIVTAQTKAQYSAQNAKLRGEAFDAMLDISASQANILAHLQGEPGSGKPFVIKHDLSKGRMQSVNFTVGAPLGQAGRRGTQQAVNFEEQLIHNSWNVTIDSLRVVVGWNEINAVVSTTGESWQEAYARLTGERVGQIEQEDMLMRLRQRSGSTNTIRPSNRAALHDLKYDDTLDAEALSRAISVASRIAKPANLGNSSSGMPVNKYVALASETMLAPLWTDPTFAAALQHAEVDGKENPYWTGNIPTWKGTAIKQWSLVHNDTPGPIGSSIEPQALLGDAITSGTAAFTVYGGGRTQASLGNQAALYKPFSFFHGANYEFGESLSYGSDSNLYYFVVIDPADGKWCAYEYAGTGVNNGGYSITISKRLHSSTAGDAATTIKSDGIGGSGTTLWTWDASVNKAAFPTGSIIVQVNRRLVPVGDLFVFGADAGAKCYGKVRNKRISQEDDYGALMGVGVHSIYGCDLKQDTLGRYRGFVRVQSAYQLDGFSLPQI